jgi:hypothetical protein
VAWPRQTGLASLQGTLQLSIAFQGVTVLCAVACEADKKQSEASQPDYDHGGNRNWPAFRYAIYKPTDILEKQFDAAARAAEQSLVPTPQPDTGTIHRLASKDYCPSDVRAYRIYGKGSASLRGQCLDHPVLAFMLGIGEAGTRSHDRHPKWCRGVR